MMRLAPAGPSRRRRRATAALLALARLGYAHWFFGNLYEAVVRVPDHLARTGTAAAEDGRPTALLRPGSPVAYYVPGAPITVGATLGALVAGWDTPGDRRWLATAAACTLSGVAATAYLVRAVNLRLFFARESVSPAERDRLLRTWYRLNGFRLVAVGGAWLAAHRAASRRR